MTTKQNKTETPKREYQFSIEEIAKQTIHAFHEAKAEKAKQDFEKQKEQSLLWEKEALKIMEPFPKLLKEAILKGSEEVILHVLNQEQYVKFPSRKDSFEPVAKGPLAILQSFFKKEEFSGFKTNLILDENEDVKFIVTWDASKIKCKT